jgi:DNA-binding LacI/PurR family transcriptional regulator
VRGSAKPRLRCAPRTAKMNGAVANSERTAYSMANPVTIYDVATRAGVSISTVSLTLNRPERVNPSTRDRVLRAIEELGYVPKESAVSRARQGVGRIGVLAPFTSYDSYRRRLMGVLAESEGTTRDVVVYDHASAAATVSPLLHALPITGRLDGLIIMGLPLDDALAEHLSSRQLPTVLVDSHRPEFGCVNVSDADGGAMVARHLLERGHRRFAFVREPQDSQAFLSQGQRRFGGFLAVLAEAGITAEEVSVIDTSNDIAGGRAALAEVFDGEDGALAIFAHHDVLAAGLLLECRSKGIRVPEDVAIVGFDDGGIAEAAGLTTVRQPFEESGRVAARLLGEFISGEAEAVRHVALGLELVARSTT